MLSQTFSNRADTGYPYIQLKNDLHAMQHSLSQGSLDAQNLFSVSEFQKSLKAAAKMIDLGGV